jgi:hypothetical protein
MTAAMKGLLTTGDGVDMFGVETVSPPGAGELFRPEGVAGVKLLA